MTIECLSQASVDSDVSASPRAASLGRTFTSRSDAFWDCGVVAADDDDAVKFPSSSRDRRGKEGSFVRPSSALSSP